MSACHKIFRTAAQAYHLFFQSEGNSILSASYHCLQVPCFISEARFRPPQNRFSFAMKAASSLILNARQDILSFSRSGKITLTRFRDKVASIARLCGRPFLPWSAMLVSNIIKYYVEWTWIYVNVDACARSSSIGIPLKMMTSVLFASS